MHGAPLAQAVEKSDAEYFRANLFDARLVLILGLGGLLSLVAVSGVFLLSRVSTLQRDHDLIREELASRSELLTRIRTHLLTISTLVRDYLLNTDRENDALLRQELSSRRSELDALLRQYDASNSVEERRESAALRSALNIYWAEVDPIWSWDHNRRLARGHQFIREEILPRRGRLLELAAKISATEKAQLAAADARIRKSISMVKALTLWTSAVLFLLGLGVAGASTIRLLRMERRASVHFADAVQSKEQLDELSIGLLTDHDRRQHRLADELHDNVGQALVALVISLDSFKFDLNANLGLHGEEELASIRRQAADIVAVVRRTCILLWPSILQDVGLSAAITSLARHLSREFSVPIESNIEEDIGLDLDQKICLYRAIEAALEHVAAGGAGRIDVSLTYTDTNAIATIKGDHPATGTVTNALGLLAARQRLTHSGGLLKVSGDASSDESVEITVPICPSANRDAHSSAEIGVGPDSSPSGKGSAQGTRRGLF